MSAFNNRVPDNPARPPISRDLIQPSWSQLAVCTVASAVAFAVCFTASQATVRNVAFYLSGSLLGLVTCYLSDLVDPRPVLERVRISRILSTVGAATLLLSGAAMVVELMLAILPFLPLTRLLVWLAGIGVLPTR